MINFFIPITVIIILVYALYKKVDIYDTFILGVKEGISLIYNIFPTMFAMIISINILKDSNIFNDISNYFNNNILSKLIPLGMLRPISSSGSLALLNNILKENGPDSFIGRVAAVIYSSTDTTIYIIGMYFSSIGIKKIKYSLLTGLIVDFICVFISYYMVKIFFY